LTEKYFITLPLPLQKALVKQKGTFLCERTSKNFVVYLFELDAFYVEVFYDRDKARIVWIHTFHNLNLLEPYLAAIDLSNLLK
jgi:hypothetical protein